MRGTPGQRDLRAVPLAPSGASRRRRCTSASRERIRAELASLGRRLKRARQPVERSASERQVGRILERHSRAASRFDVSVRIDPGRKSLLRLQWTERRDWRQWAELTEGTYMLRSNVTDWTPQELWQTYVQLWQAEAAFRIHKSDLSIRPIWHQRTERVDAHILVCFLAFAMWKTLEGWQRRAGLGNSPRTLLEELKRIQTVDVVLPVVDGPTLRLRCVTQPDQPLAGLLERLGLRLPRRLRAPLEVAGCSGKNRTPNRPSRPRQGRFWGPYLSSWASALRNSCSASRTFSGSGTIDVSAFQGCPPGSR